MALQLLKQQSQRIIKMSRYQTLNVSLQTDNHKNQSRLSQTVDYSPQKQQGQSQNNNNQSDERVRKFRELYYKNQKLRRQLKLLNAKLNEKLEKVKFPNVSLNGKKRAASVDLDRQPPNKALQRQLENGYKQIKMYKQQIQLLRIKQESSQNYAKLRDMQNSISYKDKQIADVLEQLKSIKNIKKMQQKKIVSELENEDVKQRIESYEKQHKELKDKMKQISKKSRRRDQQYKKQQAYLVSLSKKYRIATNQHNQEQEQPQEKVERPNRQISEKQFSQIKMQIEKQKKYNDEVLKKAEVLRKQIKLIKDQNQNTQQKYKEKDALAKTLQTKIISLNRLLRQQQRKPKQNPKNPLITNIQDIQLKNDKNSPKNINGSTFSDVEQDPKQHTISASKEDESLKKMLKQMEGSGLQQRQWKGKYRKVEHGFGAPGDKKFQFQGNLIGLQISLDQNQSICGIVFIFQDPKFGTRQQPIQGRRSNIQLKWQIKPNDKIIKISGSFNQQSYLNQLIVISKNGISGVFGAASSQPFTFRLSEQQRISGCFGSIRELGSDRKITELGFWIQKI